MNVPDWMGTDDVWLVLPGEPSSPFSVRLEVGDLGLEAPEEGSTGKRIGDGLVGEVGFEPVPPATPFVFPLSMSAQIKQSTPCRNTSNRSTAD